VKRLCIKSLPPVLCIQLKRFDYDWELNRAIKFDDYFKVCFFRAANVAYIFSNFTCTSYLLSGYCAVFTSIYRLRFFFTQPTFLELLQVYPGPRGTFGNFCSYLHWLDNGKVIQPVKNLLQF